MTEKISLVCCVLCVFVLLAIVSKLEQDDRLYTLHDYVKYLLYFSCFAVPIGIHVFLPAWISLIIFLPIIFLFTGYKIGTSKSDGKGG